MNKNYRMVWSEARQAFVVAHENASSRGKSSTTRKTVVARSLAAAALALGATQVQAQTTTVTGSTVSANTFNLATGQSLLNKGTIANFDAFAAVAATGGVVAGGITNNGTIAADPSLGPCCDGNQFVGVLVSKASLAQGITNTGTIYGSGTGNMSAGINIAAGTVAGGITNSGRIYSTNIFGGGIYIQSGSTLTGGIHNSGVISGASGISVQSSSISGGITNAAGGTLVGYISGRNTSAGISLWGSTVTGGIHNSGVISGSSGISIYGYPGPPSSLDTLVNNAGGSIRGTAYAGLGIHSNSQISGAVVNAGTISGAEFGIQLGTAAIRGGINNTGIIAGTTGVGILAYSASTISGGIANGVAGGKAGTISGKVTGIGIFSASTVTGGLTNSGVISGNKYAVLVDPSSILDSITIAGSNTAIFAGDVVALNTPVTVASGAVFTASNAFDVKSFTIGSGAVFNMGAMPSLSGLNAGITVAQGVSNSGTLTVAAGVKANITGNYIQSASGVYQMGAASSSSYGVLAVTGTVTLPSNAQINVDVNAINTLAIGETLKGVITSGTLVSSSFDVTATSSLFTFTGLKDGENVDLVVGAGANILQDVKANGNTPAFGAAVVLDGQIAVGAKSGLAEVISALGKFPTSRGVSDAVTQTLPILEGGDAVAIAGILSDINHVVQARVDTNLGLNSGDQLWGDQNIWLKPFGSWITQGDDYGAYGYKANVGGFAFGGDATISDTTRVGLALAYASSSVSSNNVSAPSGDSINLYQFIGYGSTVIDAQTEVNYQIDAGTNSNDSTRSIEFMGMTARGSYDSTTAHAGVGIGRTYAFPAEITITPTVRLDYTWIHNDAYQESGAGALDLHVADQSAEQMVSSFGARLTQKLDDGVMVLGNLGVGYDWLAHQNSVNATFAGAPGQSFLTEGIKPGAWIETAGIGLLFKTKGGAEITVRYDLEQREHYTDQTASIKARWAF